MKRDIKLYNLIFPMWGIYFYAILFPYFKNIIDSPPK